MPGLYGSRNGSIEFTPEELGGPSLLDRCQDLLVDAWYDVKTATTNRLQVIQLENPCMLHAGDCTTA